MADILIVEDEKNISNLIEMALSRHGHKTDCVFDGESCADVLEKKHFDLILLDVMLPKISGFELMDYIKGFDTPVIFITAKSDISDRVYGLNLGADDYITKSRSISYSFNVRSICTPFLVTILEFVSITMSLKLSFVFALLYLRSTASTLA